MKKIMLMLIALSLTTAAGASEDLMKKINALENRLEELEYKSYESIAKISGNVKHTSVSMTLKDNGDTLDGVRTFNRHLISSKIDISARPVPTLFISSRLSMKKLWYNQAYDDESTSDSKTYVDKMNFGESRQGVSPGDSSIYMERAYIQWDFIPTYTLTVGRLPLAGGSPKDILEGTPQDAPFHKFTMSEINDGAAVSKRSKFANEDELKLTFAYLPWGVFNGDTQARITNSNYESRLRDQNQNLVDNASDIYIFLSEYSSRRFNFAREFKTSMQYAYWDDVFTGSPKESNLTTKVNRYTVTADFNGLYNSKFDISLAYTYSDTSSTGSVSSYGGLFCTQGKEDTCNVNGNAFMAVLNYRATPEWAYGYLYLNNSAHNLLFDNDMDLGYILFMSPGSENHVLYTNYRFNPYLSGAFSYTRADISKTYEIANLIGSETNVDYQLDGFKLSLSARF
jgi:hypothetical protein